MPQNNPGRLRDPIWQFIGVLISFVALLFAIFAYLVPHLPTQTPTPVGGVTNSPTPTHITSTTSFPDFWLSLLALTAGMGVVIMLEEPDFDNMIAGIIGALVGVFLVILLGWGSWYNFCIGAFVGAGVSITLFTLCRFLYWFWFR